MSNQIDNKRTYKIEDKEFFFNFEAFRNKLKLYKENDPQTKTLDAKRTVLATQMNVSIDTINSWYKKKHSPMDFNIVKQLAACLGYDDPFTLLIQSEKIKSQEVHNMKRYTERKLTAIKKSMISAFGFLTSLSIQMVLMIIGLSLAMPVIKIRKSKFMTMLIN